MTQHATLLSPPINFAVVQLPERNFPGVVMQADTLNGMGASLRRGFAAIKAGDLSEALAEFEDVEELLADAQAHLEQVCEVRGVPLPY